MKLRFLFFLLISVQSFSQELMKVRGKVTVNSAAPVGTSVNTFAFTLSDSANTSAGVYTSDATLIRTLWMSERLGPGTYTRKWDGLTDYGATAPAGNYHVELLKNNVKYTWQGARIGNTSTDFAATGTIHRAGDAPLDLAIADNHLYYVAGYQERFNTIFRTNLGAIGKRERAWNDANGGGFATMQVASDGVNVYYGCYNQQGAAFSFIFAANVATGAPKTFTYGQVADPTAGEPFASTIAYMDTGANYMMDFQDIAVQTTGNKLFASRLYHIFVFDKTTGELLQNISTAGAAKLTCDANGNLWAGLGSSLIKYTVNTNGTLTNSGVAITGVLSVGALAVSPNNYNVVVCDDDTASQQVKSFRNSDGTPLWTKGTAGGYMNDASVNDNKFYFRDVRTNYLCSIAFQSDSSFWVIDGANSRMQHYAADRTFLNRIMYLSVTYVVQADLNNPTRVFCGWGGGATSNGGYLEFALNYNKTLDSGVNGSWTLVKNWGARISNQYTYFSKMQNIITIAGRTYGRMRNNSGSVFADIFELVAGGAARKTKVQFDVRQAIGRDSALYYNPSGAWPMHTTEVYRYPFAGIDANGDPAWDMDNGTMLVQTPMLDTVNAVMPNAEFIAAYTTTGKWVTFDPVYYPQSTGKDPHLGIQNFGSTGSAGYKVKTSLGTLRSYSGDFPVGYFDNGNGVGGPGGDAGGYYTVVGQNIMWTYHGEFWKTSQVNFFNHFWDNGLFVGQFGRSRTDYGDQENAYEGAGNAIHGSWSYWNADTAYVYSGDEGVNSGVHRWCISNLTSIQNQVCNFNSSLTIPAPDYVDLMPFITGKRFFTDTAIWSISHTPNNLYDSPPGYFWYTPIGTKTPSIFGPQDIWAFYLQTAGDLYSLSIDLGANVNTPSWKVTGRVTWAGNTPADDNEGGYLTVNDSTGKYIAVLQEYISVDGSQMMGNDAVIYDYTDPFLRQSTVYKSKPFEIRAVGSTFYFTYDGHTTSTTNTYTSGAIKSNPRTMQLLFSPGGKAKGVAVSDLKFYNH